MKLLGFSIVDDFISLQCDARRFDLHNDFEFVEFLYNLTKRTLVLRWHRRSRKWVKPTDPVELRLAFSGVYLFKVRERDPDVPYTEDDCLSAIGFMWDDMVEEMNGFARNEPIEGCTQVAAMFMSGLSIKVGAESVALVVTEAPV
ncbi:hypothetical protein [Pseudoxanthomonas beigongshangi]|uniref:hypothetical protein n=1 Tax=Pseudoxanthomonas beigongshangi TaxID=2782537 RepID=UPI00193B4594|nr:hypothetical protein [Pseudoxanthomonas beigongshangi]